MCQSLMPNWPPTQLDISVSSYKKWSKTAVAERATILRRTADALEAELPRFCALLVKEAFKTWGDAVSEVREAVDFLRYYANEAERIMAPIAMPGPTGESNELRLIARGPWVCISPWNFPLAIFAGRWPRRWPPATPCWPNPPSKRPVWRWKPSSCSTPRACRKARCNCCTAPARPWARRWWRHPAWPVWCSPARPRWPRSSTARWPPKTAPIVPLIAETGGINAMLVDSTALPEQVSDAVVQSAFRSAGQRCSACALLCVHEQIAHHVIEMIKALRRSWWRAIRPCSPPTCRPVIDAEAFDGIQKHIRA
jgi:RHH-type proline utilization regulon transcriptional repressor/proline dehydrogenase/delta 1-pyrroline-5-carboxylate dehydrogenase